MIRARRPSRQTTTVLTSFLAEEGWKYGYQLSKETSLPSGTIYPILIRLADRGLVESKWSEAVDGRPPRHMYRLTSDGERYARAASKSSGQQAPRQANPETA